MHTTLTRGALVTVRLAAEARTGETAEDTGRSLLRHLDGALAVACLDAWPFSSKRLAPLDVAESGYVAGGRSAFAWATVVVRPSHRDQGRAALMRAACQVGGEFVSAVAR